MPDDSVSKEAPALVGIGAQSIVDRARDLGLTWTIRPATVVTAEQPALSVNPAESIIYDGDDEAITAINLTGRVLSVTNRVMAIGVPPAANYIIGFLTVIRNLIVRADEISGTGAITAETVVLTTPIFTLENGRAAEVLWAGNVFTAGAATFHLFRTRVTGLGGTLLSFAQTQIPAGGAQSYQFGRAVVKRTSAGDFRGVIAGTSQGSPNAVTWTGATTDVRYLEVRDVGPATDYPDAINIA